jgi:hypothetical protein
MSSQHPVTWFQVCLRLFWPYSDEDDEDVSPGLSHKAQAK